MIASGANVKTVQSQLGHKTATMTLDQYGHLSAMTSMTWPTK
jgi:integrase